MRRKNRSLTWEELANLHKEGGPLSQSCADILKRISLDEAYGSARTFLVTSALDREGKTFTAVNLAVSLARQGWKTLLVDADLRRPVIADFFGIDNSSGLANFLSESSQKIVVTQDRHFPDLYLLPGGTAEGIGQEIFLSRRFQAFREKLNSSYEYILFDSSSVNNSLDPLILGKLVDGVVLVVQCDRTQRSRVLAARDLLQKNQGKIAGVVLNRVPKYVPSYYKM